jgi:hypothetical protein
MQCCGGGIKVITYLEVAQIDIFMEQKMRFGLVLGWFWAGWQY